MPRLPLLFARRYLFSKKSHSVINIISGVSAFAVAVPVMAMVILLSVFNGFEGLIRSMYRSFDPELLVTPVHGKFFDTHTATMDSLRRMEQVAHCSFFIDENALFEYNDRQAVGVMRGVDSSFYAVVPIDSLLSEGSSQLQHGEQQQACVGQGMAYTLGIRTVFNDPLRVYLPARGSFSPLLPQNLYRSGRLFPAGVFALEAEVDGKYILVPLSFAQELLNKPGQATGIALRLKDEQQESSVQQQIATLVGDNFRVETRMQQKADFYRIMLYEKWGIYFIILLVLVIASFSLIGSLVMLIIDKRKDIATLQTMGAELSLIRRIFVAEGMLTYSIGALGGMMLGVGIALAQQHWGFLQLSGETFLVKAYPVQVEGMDLVMVLATFLLLSYLIATLTVRSMIGRNETDA